MVKQKKEKHEEKRNIKNHTTESQFIFYLLKKSHLD